MNKMNFNEKNERPGKERPVSSVKVPWEPFTKMLLEFYKLKEHGALTEEEYLNVKVRMLEFFLRGIEIPDFSRGGVKAMNTSPSAERNSEECSQEQAASMPKAKGLCEKREKVCKVCGKTFQGTGAAKYCSDVCRKEGQRLDRQGRLNKQKQEDAEAVMPKPPAPVVQSEKLTGPCKRKDCMYIGKTGRDVTCDYVLHTGEPRGCSIAECDKYKRIARGK